MAEKCDRQSRSTCSNQSARTQSTFPQTRNIKQNDAPLRCTCPHPPGNRATVQSAQAIPHPSFLSHSFTGHHTACHHPNPPKLARSHDTCHYSHCTLPRNFSRFNHPEFGGGAHRTSAIFTPSQTSASCPSDYCNPQFARAQMIHSDQNDKNIDGRIRRIYYLRAHLKHSGELFVAEYCRVQRLRCYQSLFADWKIPSCHPFYSLVFMRRQIQDPMCCTSLQNLCVSTIGGTGKQNGGPFHGHLPRDGCKKLHDGRKKKQCSDLDEAIRPKRNIDSINISEGQPLRPSCSSFSESLTLENSVYDSEDPQVFRRIPFTTESSKSSPCVTASGRYTDDSGASRKSRKTCNRSSAVKNKANKRRSCHRCGTDDSSVPNKDLTSDNISPPNCSGREAVEVLQNLESFFGLKSTRIECTQSERSESQTTSNRSIVTTATLICSCLERCASSGCVVHRRPQFSDSTFRASDATTSTTIKSQPSSSECPPKDYDSSLTCSCKPYSMISVQSIHGSTANEIVCSPPNPCSDDYHTVPNDSPKGTVSGAREDSRSGGRGYRRPTLQVLDGSIPCQCSISNITTTAQPLFDPGCNQCAEARLADRLCETLDAKCSCTPIIRTGSDGRISFIDSSLYTPVSEYSDAVMNEKNKRSLSKYIAHAKDGGITLREAVMQWVKRRSEMCKTRMNKQKKT